MRYCNNCNQTVEPKKNVSFIVLVLLLLFLILPGIIYLIYCLFQTAKCPICNGKNWRNVGSPPKVMKKAYREHGTSAEEARIKEEAAKIEEEAAKIEEEYVAEKTYVEEIDKQLIEEEGEKRTRVKISPKERLKNSPSIQGALIGVVLVVILVGIVSISTHQVLYMANDTLAPDVNESDLMKYQEIPLSKIKKNDIIVYISPTGETAYKIGKVRSIESSSTNVDRVLGFKTSNNVSPQKLDYVPAENFIGKITDVGVYPVGKILHENFNPKMLLMIIVAFAAPIIILKVRKRLQN